MTFTDILPLLRKGQKVINPKGTILFMKDDRIVYGIPHSQYPKGQRVETKLYWDSVFSDQWEVFLG